MTKYTNPCPFCEQLMRDDSMEMMNRHYDLHSCFNWECEYWSTTLSMEEWQNLTVDHERAAKYRKSCESGRQSRRGQMAVAS